MEKDKQTKQDQELQKIMNNFNQSPLNLTDQGKNDDLDQQDPQLAQKIKKQYQMFMQSMKNGSMQGLQSQQGLQGLTQALGQLLGGFGENLGIDPTKAQNDFKNIFQGNGDDDAIQKMAEKLLQTFMKKQLLQQPLQQCKKSYEKYFDSEQCKNLSVQQQDRFRNQYKIIIEIITVLDTTPNETQKLIGLFEKMQQYGQPPTGVTSVSVPGM